MRFIHTNSLTSLMVCVAVLCLFSCPPLIGDWYIEQKTTTKSGENPETESIQKIYLKDKMMKVEDSSSNITMYFRLDKDVIRHSDNTKKTYYETKLTQMLQIMKMFKQNQVVELKDTGNEKKIGKYKCHEYHLTNKSQLMEYSMEMWVTKEIKIMDEFKDLFKVFKQYSSEMHDKIAALKAYPVLTKTTNNFMGTQVVNTTLLTKAEEKKFNTKIFEIPSGYKLEEPVNPFQAIQEKVDEKKGKTDSTKEKPPVKNENSKTK